MSGIPSNFDSSKSGPDWTGVRADFPILQEQINGFPLVYLDNAATTHKPRAVLEAMQRFYERDNANVHRGMHTLGNRATTAYEAARDAAARFLGARHREEIIFTRGTTEGINLVANTWAATQVREGEVILLTEMEHHSNLVPWQMLARRLGAHLVYLRVTGDEGELDWAQARELLASGRVKLFSLVHISNLLGVINPVRELCALARRHGVVTLVDAAQSIGHMPVDVQELGCDFLVFSGHKMCGPTGIGVLYGRAEILEQTPPWQGGGEMIEEVDFGVATYALPPYRFEAGTPNIAGAIGLHAAMEYLEGIGRQAIYEHDQELCSHAYEQLSCLEGIRLLGPRRGRSGLVSFVLPDVHAHDLVTLADQQGLALRGGHHCTQPLVKRLQLPALTRASFYLYNNLREVDRLLEVVREVRALFAT